VGVFTSGPAAIYVRISDDPDLQRLGVQRQERECRGLADQLGWVVDRVYEDDDRSAFRRTVVRRAYQQLLDDIRAGQWRRLIVWHPDRMHRRPAELEEFIAVVEEAGVEIATVKAGTLDLSTPSGRMVARIVGATAAYESEHKAERIRSKMAEIASAGRWKGGTRPFGWKPDGVTEVPEEVELLREAKDRAGLSWRDVSDGIETAYSGSALFRSGLGRSRMERVAVAVRDPELHDLAVSDVFWDQITAIVPCGEETVYDMTIPDVHNFVANGIVVSNSIEQDADIVMFIHREELYKPDTDRKNIADIILAKHRNGPVGQVPVRFFPSQTRFADSTAWYFAETIFDGHSAPWSTPADQSAVALSSCGRTESISMVIWAARCCVSGW